MPGLRAQKRRSTSEAILGAALDLFCECGYHATSVPRLAERAGVGTGTIYRHFANKEALVNAVFQHCKTAMSQALFGDLQLAHVVNAPPREVFGRFYQRLFDFAVSHPRELAFIEFHHHAVYLDQASQSLENEALAPVALWVDRAVAQGTLRPIATPTAIAMLWGAFTGLIKAERLGLLTVDAAVRADAEDAAWHSIAHPRLIAESSLTETLDS